MNAEPLNPGLTELVACNEPFGSEPLGMSPGRMLRAELLGRVGGLLFVHGHVGAMFANIVPIIFHPQSGTLGH